MDRQQRAGNDNPAGAVTRQLDGGAAPGAGSRAAGRRLDGALMSKPHLHATAALLWAWLALTPTPAMATSATDLLAKRRELQPQLLARTYGEPLYLTSREGVDQMAGDAYAELALPFAQLSSVLTVRRHRGWTNT